MIRKFLQIFIIFSLTSCGFQVIYKEKKTGLSYEKELAAIKIQKDSGRLSQELRNALHDLFNPDNLKIDAKYILVLNTQSFTTSTFTTSTGSSGRNRVVINIKYELIDIKDGKLLAQGETNVGDNYDVQTNRFGTYSADEYTRLNVTKVAAQNIRNFLV
ncbi:MAG TPA: LPS assembly lipoprotein LptE, partial [Rickettsiales bacterium]|nr:LPS assembly lipoprotein LptE [Rickettsiales bacterium]